MAALAQSYHLTSELGRFLYFEVGQEENGTPLTILSALARLGLDPWREAARLAQLPKDEAAQELAFLIARLPRPVELPERQAIVNRLAELLPKPALGASGRTQSDWTTLMMWAVLGSILLMKPLLAIAILSGWLDVSASPAPVRVSPEPFPSRPIQLIVSTSQGDPDDAIARLISDRLAGALGQPMSPEAHARVAAGPLVAQAEPDGHTLLIAQAAEVAIDPVEFRTADFDPRRDLQPIALVGVAPLAITVPAVSPWTTMSDLMAASRSSSLGLSFVSAEPGTPESFASQMLRSRIQTRLAREPDDGRGTLEDLLIGRADVCLCSLPSVLPHVASGTLRIIAVSSPKRSLTLPNVPTLIEEMRNGVSDVTHWIGVFAPRGTPSAVAEQLNREVNRILGQPDVREQLLSRGIDLMPMSVNQFASFVDTERRKYADLRREAFCARTPLVGCSRSHFLLYAQD